MSELKITDTGSGYDLVQQHGELVMLTDETDIVVQRVRYRLMTWFRESPYDRSIGVPYVDGVFGLEPVEAMVFLLTRVILETDGVDGIVGQPTYELDEGRSLSITCILDVGGDEVDFASEVFA